MSPLQVSSHAYKLELPALMKVHPVFHVSLLEPATSDPLPGQLQPPPPPVIIDEEPEWEVDEIVDSKFMSNTLRYLIRWLGYADLTWELSTMLTNVPSAVKRFHQLYPSKPRPWNIPTWSPNTHSQGLTELLLKRGSWCHERSRTLTRVLSCWPLPRAEVVTGSVDCRPRWELTLLPLSWHPISLLLHLPRLGTVFAASGIQPITRNLNLTLARRRRCLPEPCLLPTLGPSY